MSPSSHFLPQFAQICHPDGPVATANLSGKREKKSIEANLEAYQEIIKGGVYLTKLER